ncbi:IgGFc-binding protein-like [Pecten maximus]|uniref:IgGFc-binding protein-like n=1 Tax=Pecten maximus TaxID=6579 RepID=UPI00145889CF|nr:IgGFc-binding protein-like [Pecten maximus]
MSWTTFYKVGEDVAGSSCYLICMSAPAVKSTDLYVRARLSLGNVFDNQGKEFIIAFMENNPNDENLDLFITTFSNDNVSVTVNSLGYHGNGFINKQFHVSRGSTTLVSVDIELRMEGSSLSPKGIVVQANEEIIVYGVNRQHYTSDAFLGLPTDVLGQEYYTVTFLPTTPKSYAQYAQLLVVSAFNDTQVQITFPESDDFSHVTFDGIEYHGGDTLNITMDRCDALQLQAEGYFDLTGAYIKSDKPVALFSGNIRAVVGVSSSSDHLVEQLISTDRWGKRFVIVPIPAREIGDYFKVVANTDATGIDIKCINNASIITSERIVLAKAGSYELVEMDPKSYCYIVANNSVLIVQIVKSDQNDDHDPALILIPPLEQYAAEYMFTTPRRTDGSYENFFLFVVKEEDKDGLRIDGVPFPSTIEYVSIPDTSLVAGYIAIGDGFHRFNHISPISVFGGFMYGRYAFETYGMPVGLRMAEINKPCSMTADEIGDGRDNDCDGLIDEELCTDVNAGQDDDGDGKVDEDCAMAWLDDWDEWSTWTECIQTRNRTCKVRSIGESYCPGPNNESMSCGNVETGIPREETTEGLKTLRVDRKNTSKYRRSLSSAPDDRKSSAVRNPTVTDAHDVLMWSMFGEQQQQQQQQTRERRVQSLVVQ